MFLGPDHLGCAQHRNNQRKTASIHPVHGYSPKSRQKVRTSSKLSVAAVGPILTQRTGVYHWVTLGGLSGRGRQVSTSDATGTCPQKGGCGYSGEFRERLAGKDESAVLYLSLR